MKLVFVIRAGPYAFQHMQTATDLASAALDAGHGVGFFLAEDSVVAMNASAKTGSERNFTTVLTELSARGAEVQGCGACCQFRGQKRSDLAECFRVAGVASLAKMVAEADRVLSFGY
jgi:sulfur relay (sulfurtransferase) complex TusBCD TusD component (DsrE family)